MSLAHNLPKPFHPTSPAPRAVAESGRWLALALWAGLAALLALAAVRPAGLAAITPPAGLALVMGALILFVAGIVSSFSRRYMRADRAPARFFAGVGLLVGSILFVVFTGNLVGLALGWVASGVLLARLIGHDAGWAEARRASLRALGTFAIGDAALLAALVLLGVTAGTVQLDGVLAAAPQLPAGVTLVAALLLLVAAAARCALPPFAGWLLSSMTAPTPVSALMHAGLVNAGGFLLIRFAPLFEAAPAARLAAVVLGLAAAVYGIGVMSVRPDVKRALAGSTVSQMGFMIMSCGLGAYAAALWHIVAHGLFKAWLFLGSGSAVGTRADKPARLAGTTTLVVIAGTTLALGFGLILVRDTSGNLVPLLLGLATALAALAAGLGGALAWRARIGIALLVLALIGFHAAGLGLIHGLLGPDGPAILPAWALLGLLGGFLTAWVWQQHRLARAAPLPPALYIHLLNAGSNPASPET